MQRTQKLTVWLMLAVAMMFTFNLDPARAQEASSANLNPTDDGFTSGNDGPINELGLIVAFSGGLNPAVSEYGLLKFDLAGGTGDWQAGEVIGDAVLSLAALSCNGTAIMDVALYGMDDSFDGWNEGSMPSYIDIEAALPAATLLMSTSDQGPIDGSAPGYYTYTDDGGTTGQALVAWLEAERTSGDGLATILLVPVTTEIKKVTFEDREESFLALGCDESAGPPRLDLFATATPTAISGTQQPTDGAQSDLAASLLPPLLLLAAASLLWGMRRRRVSLR